MDVSKASLKELEDKCRLLEGQCMEYVEELKAANHRLESQIARCRIAEQRIHYSEARFRKIFEYAPFGAAMTDIDGKIKLFNRALCGMLAHEKSELEDRYFTEFTHPDDRDIDRQLFKRLSSNEIDHYAIEKRYIGEKGNMFWGSLAVTIVKEPVSNEAMIIHMIEDITQRKESEEELKKNQDRLESIVVQRTSEIRSLKDRLQAENMLLKQELADSHRYGTIIGQSHSIKSVISQIELVSPTKSSVLIQGGSGTGKELVAREIHKHGPRKGKAFIKVNCAAIPKELYESEFFGHVKGAYTSAVNDRVGRFEAADGGTIFLDEVGEIPLSVQSKLLRVLQEGEYERLGEERTRHVDVRVIAATNKNLRDEVKNKHFRDDLFYRLNVFPIHISPLKDRIDDIPLLASHFTDKLSKEMNLPKPILTKANIMDLQSYNWPGNVRELENAIERAMILSRSKKLNFNAILETDEPPKITTQRTFSRPDADAILSADDMYALEKENMIRALRRCKWKIYGDDGAAGMLGLKPTTLIERMKRMKIKKPGK
jgi:hydrogenase-4 transcriptional activator